LRRNCVLKYVTEGRLERGIEVAERLGRKSKHLLDGLKETRGKLEEEAQDRTLWKTRLGKGYGPVVRIKESLKTGNFIRVFVGAIIS
jgi:hypothetical protein